MAPCRCRTGTLKNPTKYLWRWEPDRRYNFFFSPPAHLCRHICNWNIVACGVKHKYTHTRNSKYAASICTYFKYTVYVQRVSNRIQNCIQALARCLSPSTDSVVLYRWVSDLVTLRHIQRYSVINVTAHTCACGIKKLDLRSGSQRQRHSVGFFNVQVDARGRHFYSYSEKPPHFSRLLRCARGYGGHVLILNPRVPTGRGSSGVFTKVTIIVIAFQYLYYRHVI